jgi:hypothetical protein
LAFLVDFYNEDKHRTTKRVGLMAELLIDLAVDLPFDLI